MSQMNGSVGKLADGFRAVIQHIVDAVTELMVELNDKNRASRGQAGGEDRRPCRNGGGKRSGTDRPVLQGHARRGMKAAGMLKIVLVLLAVPASVSAQRATPGEKADSLMALAEAVGLPSASRARLLFEAQAEWYEEGARAVLTGQRDRLARAMKREGYALVVGGTMGRPRVATLGVCQ